MSSSPLRWRSSLSLSRRVWFVSTQNWVTAGNPEGAFIPPNLGPGIFGWSGVLRGAAVVFFAYIGFDAVSTAAQEASNPQRDMPIGILGSLGDLHAALCAGELRHHRHCALRQAQRADPIAVGVDAIGLDLAVAHHQARRDLGPNLGHPRAAARPAADLLFHVTRRAAAAVRARRFIRAFARLTSPPSYRHHRLDSSRGCCRSALSVNW